MCSSIVMTQIGASLKTIVIDDTMNILGSLITIVIMLIVQATMGTIINYDCNTFTVPATGCRHDESALLTGATTFSITTFRIMTLNIKPIL
jgi:hypothetical protein